MYLFCPSCTASLLQQTREFTQTACANENRLLQKNFARERIVSNCFFFPLNKKGKSWGKPRNNRYCKGDCAPQPDAGGSGVTTSVW